MDEKKTTARAKVLIVDDNELNRAMLAEILEDEYQIFEAENGVEAVDFLGKHAAEIALVLLDIVMPEMDGFDVLAKMAEKEWLGSIPVIMISAEKTQSLIDKAYDLGATDYITRPYEVKTVIRRSKNAVMLYAKQKVLEQMVTEQIMEKERNNSQMVQILSNIVEFRNGESGLHVLHIRIMTDMLLQTMRRKAPEMGLTASRIALIANASALHDVGKIAIDEKILNKPGRFTPEEFEEMKKHTTVGAEMLQRSAEGMDSEMVQVAYKICRWHHERYDGRGYPDGLKGEEIPIEAQVVAMADVYDALTSKRVYKPPFSHDKALEMIMNGECGVFNPLLLECLQDCADQLAEAMEVRSSREVNNMEMQRVASELISKGELRVSGQTITLLEQERRKFAFFADVMQEIIFEYDRDSRLLRFNEWGAKHLGLKEKTYRLGGEKKFLHDNPIFIGEVAKALAGTSFQNPRIEIVCTMTVEGRPQQFRAQLRSLWDGDQAPTYVRVVGLLTPLEG